VLNAPHRCQHRHRQARSPPRPATRLVGSLATNGSSSTAKDTVARRSGPSSLEPLRARRAAQELRLRGGPWSRAPASGKEPPEASQASMTVNHRSRIQPTPHRRRASETDSQRGSYHDESYPHHLDRIHLFSIAHPITIFNPSSPRPGNNAGLPRSNRPVVAFPPVNAERPNRRDGTPTTQ